MLSMKAHIVDATTLNARLLLLLRRRRRRRRRLLLLLLLLLLGWRPPWGRPFVSFCSYYQCVLLISGLRFFLTFFLSPGLLGCVRD